MFNLLATAEQAGNFWDFNAWGFINILAILLLSLILANVLKRKVGFIRKSLIPTSVLGGLILLIVSFTYTMIVGKDELGNYKNIFDIEYFGGNGLKMLYLITYHCLALGFIASTLKNEEKTSTKKERVKEVFNSGVHTVLGYLLQAGLGLIITITLSLTLLPELFKGSGVLLAFGYGQGTGQALNWGTVYETKHGFIGGANFGLTIAALGFLSASIGGVIYLHSMRKKGRLKTVEEMGQTHEVKEFLADDEVPFTESMDKMSVQFALVLGCYAVSNLVMWGLSALLPSMKETVYGFNFLIGALFAVLLKVILKGLRKKNVVKHEYVNNYLMARITGFAFDLMIVAGFAAIEIQLLANYWHVLLIMAVIGTVATFFYCKFICDKLFPAYKDEQFLAMYGMLTGTASTGMVLLHEIDPDYKTPAASNLVYQQLPAILFGFPLMLLAPMAPDQTYLVLGVVIGMFILLNIILFRDQIFSKFKKKKQQG